ncbi:MAG: serine hydrolase domain-containing protein [Acidimicrobiia bacterium]
MPGRSEALGRVATWPVDHAAAVALGRDGDPAFAGEVDRTFELASVTKLLTAAAVLVAVQEEVVALDDPAGPAGSTVAHLLAHASGLAPEGRDPMAAPGTRRIYSNAGFDLLGELVEAAAGMPFAAYLDAAVLEPLAMASTVLDGSPARAARSTARDLARFARELLAPGRVLDPATVEQATRPVLADLSGVLPGYGRQDPNPWGLGFEIRGTKAPHWTPPTASARTFGHFGQSGTFLWVDPDPGVALVALTDRAFGEWAVEAWPELGVAVLAAEEA